MCGRCVALGGLVLTAGLVALLADRPAPAQQPPGEVFRSKEGQFSVRFPGKPKENTQTAKGPAGDLTVYTATFATTEGNVYLVSYTDFPQGTVRPEDHQRMFDGVRDGLKRDGKVLSEVALSVGPEKLPGREIVIEKEKPKQLVRVRVMIRDHRFYQVAVVGSDAFVKGKEATAFLDSFEVTK